MAGGWGGEAPEDSSEVLVSGDRVAGEGSGEEVALQDLPPSRSIIVHPGGQSPELGQEG